MKSNERYIYKYSASERKEIEKIKKKYEITDKNSEKNNLEKAKELDKKISKKATLISLIIGIISCLVMGCGMSLIMTDIGSMMGILNSFLLGFVMGIIGMVGVVLAYPVYKLVLAKERRRNAKIILDLIEKIE